MPLFAEGTGVPLEDMQHNLNGTLNGRSNNSTGQDPASTSTESTMTPSEGQVPDRIRIKNRRKRYLDLHPEYFGPQLELADPLLYDRLIRRFQSSAEREAEGRQKGFSGVLEADLLRSEAKLDALAHPDPNSMFTYKRGPDGEILAEDSDDVPANKEEGFARWQWEMEARFVRGDDDDFDYSAVDVNPEYDDVKTEEREAEERYFDQQEPEFVVETEEEEAEEKESGLGDGDDRQKRRKSHELQGETGIQDF
ncbi:hypothetical protein HRR83_009493 [Exophiala dermatitidis]|uniref:CCD97-like C-terminal domain-containing protein n=1 Tax=Exophiala dermatitidis TaxID=5970 RepID=A0AAN6ENG1_EXODE|nr:hypothetical protein HRR75_008258 [Exophiala dermatitidis]KAJ4504343.1 hypothetical protein HRR74_008989 [Exophiala dermatitidis]KAJ4504887.1 hypothetical protein HRR73_008641 [Exophiala dermatitidis]KAJ4530779.1 hypothetical protein HRR76_008476 [Exophiala dermatitidis]KAJ4531483.1 hypothetical protein HRR77_009466 [Exophiala dermatitidis]